MPLGLAAARRRRPTLEAAVRRPSDQSGPTSTIWPRPGQGSTVALGTRFLTPRPPGRAGAGGPPGHVRLAVAVRHGRRERGARAFARGECGRVVFLEPEHLGAAA